MIQLFLLIVSFSYGLITGLVYNLIFVKLLKIERYYVIFNMIFFIIITMIYVAIFFFLNNGDIHLYLKIVLVIGFALSFKVSNLSQRVTKNTLSKFLNKLR